MMAGLAVKKFPDFVPPTKVSYLDRGPTLHLRRCILQIADDPTQEWTFDKEEIRIGSMDDNDIVLSDDTVSRYHCRIIQDDTSYILADNTSTNGTFINKVRVRDAFLRPGCIVSVGQSQLRFNAREEEVQIVPSRADRCGGLIGGNAKMREIYSIIEKIAPTATTVVIDGETGTGKEVVAQAIHSLSPRSRNELVVFDCGAVPPNLIESELFGHEKGSFTGAVMSREGLFEMADGGTLFLDELGELPLDLQPKLLRALEQREVRRVGGAKSQKVDVRIIAATNRKLEAMVAAGEFREDLYFRLCVVEITVPPLRQRLVDLPALCASLLPRAARRCGRAAKPIAVGAMERMAAYAWPGNVRELENVLERALVLGDGIEITAADLELADRPAPPEVLEPRDASVPHGEVMEDIERRRLTNALRDAAGNQSTAARALGMPRTTFINKLRRHGLL